MLKNNETILQAAKAAPLISKEAEAIAATAWRTHGDEQARELLFRSYLRLVVRIVGRMRGQASRFDDLLSAGAMGLLVAIDRFDPDTGFRLGTYAPFWIRSHLADDTYGATNVVRLPVSEKYRRALAHYHDARRRLGIEHGGRLTHRELVALSSMLEVSIDIAQMVDAKYDGWSISMQAPSGAKDGTETFGDRFQSSEPTPAQNLAMVQKDEWAKDVISRCMEGLRPREREVLMRRELDDETTLQDLADEYGVSRQRVQQIQAHALRKFKKAVMQHRAMARIHLNMPDLLSAG
jgi:RNA polymerase sigma-32 factor